MKLGLNDRLFFMLVDQRMSEPPTRMVKPRARLLARTLDQAFPAIEVTERPNSRPVIHSWTDMVPTRHHIETKPGAYAWATRIEPRYHAITVGTFNDGRKPLVRETCLPLARR